MVKTSQQLEQCTHAETAGRHGRKAGRRRGSVAVIVALSLVAVMGFAALGVDYGLLNADVNRLQRGVDAAALAGATKLRASTDDTADAAAAKALAVRVAAQNKVTVVPADVLITDSNQQIQVTANYTRQLLFARVIGFKTADLVRAATARVTGGVPATPKISPIGISSTLFDKMKADYKAGLAASTSYDQVMSRHGQGNTPGDFNDANFILFDLSDSQAKSSPNMRDQLTGDQVVKIDLTQGTVFETALNAQTNAQYAKYADAMQTIFQRAAASPWFDAPVNGAIDNSIGTNYSKLLAGTEPPNNPRVLNLIVTPDTGQIVGNADLPVTTFAPVYVERVYSSGGEYHTIFRYLPENYAFRSSGASYLIK